MLADARRHDGHFANPEVRLNVLNQEVRHYFRQCDMMGPDRTHPFDYWLPAPSQTVLARMALAAGFKALVARYQAQFAREGKRTYVLEFCYTPGRRTPCVWMSCRGLPIDISVLPDRER